MRTLALVLLSVLAACVVHTRPYVEEYVIGDRHGVSLGDGPPASEKLVVRNPTSQWRTVDVYCGSTVKSHWRTDPIAPGGYVQGIAWLMDRDIGASTCDVGDDEPDATCEVKQSMCLVR